MNTADLRTLLTSLTAERLDAAEGGDHVHLARLEGEIAAARRAYTLEAVTEIASLRAQLTGAAAG